MLMATVKSEPAAAEVSEETAALPQELKARGFAIGQGAKCTWRFSAPFGPESLMKDVTIGLVGTVEPYRPSTKGQLTVTFKKMGLNATVSKTDDFFEPCALGSASSALESAASKPRKLGVGVTGVAALLGATSSPSKSKPAELPFPDMTYLVPAEGETIELLDWDKKQSSVNKATQIRRLRARVNFAMSEAAHPPHHLSIHPSTHHLPIIYPSTHHLSTHPPIIYPSIPPSIHPSMVHHPSSIHAHIIHPSIHHPPSSIDPTIHPSIIHPSMLQVNDLCPIYTKDDITIIKRGDTLQLYANRDFVQGELLIAPDGLELRDRSYCHSKACFVNSVVDHHPERRHIMIDGRQLCTVSDSRQFCLFWTMPKNEDGNCHIQHLDMSIALHTKASKHGPTFANLATETDEGLVKDGMVFPQIPIITNFKAIQRGDQIAVLEDPTFAKVMSEALAWSQGKNDKELDKKDSDHVEDQHQNMDEEPAEGLAEAAAASGKPADSGKPAARGKPAASGKPRASKKQRTF